MTENLVPSIWSMNKDNTYITHYETRQKNKTLAPMLAYFLVGNYFLWSNQQLREEEPASWLSQSHQTSREEFTETSGKNLQRHQHTLHLLRGKKKGSTFLLYKQTMQEEQKAQEIAQPRCCLWHHAHNPFLIFFPQSPRPSPFLPLPSLLTTPHISSYQHHVLPKRLACWKDMA